MKVKTRGKTSPKGKPRVYFSCHRDDFNLLFETLSDEILSIQDCAIYYVTEDELNNASEGEILTELTDMQLFVIPVTFRYLTEDSFSVNYEYGYAIEHHIPIVPITVEVGISSQFAMRMNEKGSGYGDIQFLNRVSSDSTEIPYIEKLKNILESVLLGDEISERIRKAFDSYIFLSYRKKDRFYARELMKSIHHIPQLRSVAIWYDEFLIPGENWSDSITEAMEKSSLVALAVTPNLTEPGNYIIEHEYPDAVKMGKEIVAAELVPTDYRQLIEVFGNLPKPIDGYDDEMLAQALKALVGNGSENELEQCFLIGLAYLGGVDVERDTGYASEMIVSAAEKGLEEAVAKLVSMYNTGDGVERDYSKAVMWQEKLVSILENKPDRRENRKLVAELWNLGDMWNALGMPSKAIEAYTFMLKYARERELKYYTLATRRDVSIALNLLGRIYEDVEDYEKAIEYYSKALTGKTEIVRYLGVNASIWNSEETEEEMDNPKCDELNEMQIGALRDLATSISNIADIYISEENSDAAMKELIKAYRIGKCLEQTSGSEMHRRDFSVICNTLGTLYRNSGELEKALELYEKALKITEELNSEHSTPESRRDITICCDRIGSVYEKMGNIEYAIGFYLESQERREELYDELGTVEAYEDYCIACLNLGKLGEDGMLETAFEGYAALAENCPEVSRYASLRDYIASIM